MVKPSAVPASNQEARSSATCSAEPTRRRWPEPCGALLDQLARSARSLGDERAGGDAEPGRERTGRNGVGKIVDADRIIGTEGVRGQAEVTQQCGGEPLDRQQIVELLLAPTRLLLSRRDQHHHAERDLHIIAMTTGRGRALPNVIAERDRLGLGLGDGEHDIGEVTRQLEPALGPFGLHDHRSTLRARSHRQRPGDREELALVIDAMDLVGVGVATGRLVRDQPVRLPAVPQPGDHVEEFPGPPVPGLLLRMIGQTEIRCGSRCSGGHDIDRRPPLRHVIERLEPPREVVGEL